MTQKSSITIMGLIGIAMMLLLVLMMVGKVLYPNYPWETLVC